MRTYRIVPTHRGFDVGWTLILEGDEAGKLMPQILYPTKEEAEAAMAKRQRQDSEAT